MRKITLAVILGISIFYLFPGTAIAGVEHDGATLVVGKSQVPQMLLKYKPSMVYVLYFAGPIKYQDYEWAANIVKRDTIINLKAFVDSANRWHADVAFRLIFENHGHIDSLYEFDHQYHVISKIFNLNYNFLSVREYDEHAKEVRKFIFNYTNKRENYFPTLADYLRNYQLYGYYEIKNALSSVWIVSIGIDDYGTNQLKACKSDARSYISFFREEYAKLYPVDSLFHSYYLPDSLATKKNILSALQDIAKKAKDDDYFIFTFSGESNLFSTDSTNYRTYFFPYEITGSPENAINRNLKDTSSKFNNMLSLKTIQEYIQQIPAINQLFISEAGPSAKFKTEFIKSLMQNSATVSSILNKNRIIIVPNDFGMEGPSCGMRLITKGYINDFITSLDTSKNNIYSLFEEDKSKSIAIKLKMKQYSCRMDLDYFDIFFERQFLQQYREIFGDAVKTRGAAIEDDELNKASGSTGRRYALVIGTDHYKAKDWPTLSNPVFDAKEVAAQLRDNYGFEVRQLYDQPMDSIYNNIGQYYRALKKEDQFIIYIAGHGDFDRYLLDDGFVVCTDSKSVAEDPMRNTYIQHSKLKKMINKMSSSQTLVLLDICFGGTFDENILGNKRENTGNTSVNANVLQLLHENAKYKTRRVLSSTGVEPAFDGAAGKHSPFANLLLQVLNAKGAAKNGIVTLSDIFAVLQTASLNEGILRITPYKASFGDDEPLGEFILIPQEKPAEKLAVTKK